MIDRRRILLAGGVLALAGFGLPARRASAAGTLRVASLRFGSLSWLLETMRAEGIADKLGLTITVVDVATNQAGPVALLSGEADVIVSDWPWALRQRAYGRACEVRAVFVGAGRGDGGAGFTGEDAGRSQGQTAGRRRRRYRQELAAAARLFASGRSAPTFPNWRCRPTAPRR